MTRKKFNIIGSEVEDIVLSLFCGGCTLAQAARHIYNYDKGDSIDSCDAFAFSRDGRTQHELNRAVQRQTQYIV